MLVCMCHTSTKATPVTRKAGASAGIIGSWSLVSGTSDHSSQCLAPDLEGQQQAAQGTIVCARGQTASHK